MKAYTDAGRSSLREAAVADRPADSPRAINRFTRNSQQRRGMKSGRFGTIHRGQHKETFNNRQNY
ncbi:hypothetical protein L2Y90_00310 [Burkholderia pyrrocinia]|uniref:hypothetical protein n=1 Tax=Burkholderia pyrrocinia TaxID=60550 RepID=UPI00215A7E8A|nr:hypothetical protein [Burkholderia pyrrocinia]UVE65610.1 hypothetical protein L2Y90_00310 [Burkholderia pyrrocinia]